MTKNNTIYWIIGIALVVIIAVSQSSNLPMFQITGEESITRDVPSQVNPGQEFTITYNTDVSGKFGASVVDAFSGGCQFQNGETEKKFVMLSEPERTVTVTASPSEGSCTLSGDYKFGSSSTKDFQDKTITISTGNGGDGDGYEPPSDGESGNGEKPSGGIQWNNELFKIGEFSVTVKILAYILGGLLLIKLISSNK